MNPVLAGKPLQWAVQLKYLAVLLGVDLVILTFHTLSVNTMVLSIISCVYLDLKGRNSCCAFKEIILFTYIVIWL